MVGFGDDFARYCVTAGIIILVANVAASFGTAGFFKKSAGSSVKLLFLF